MVAALVLLLSVNETLTAQQWPEYRSLDSIYSVRDSLELSLAPILQSDSAGRIESWMAYIKLQKEQAEFERELLVAQAMVERFPTDPLSHFSLGDACLDNSLVDEAIVALRFAIELQPKYVRALTTLSEAYQMIYLHDSALYFLDSALICNPSNEQAHFQRAELLNDMGRRIDAIASYREWAMLQPFNSAPWVKLGQAQIVVGDYNEALESLGYALSLDDEIDPLVHFLIAEANEGLGRHHEARKGYADFFLRFPTHKKAMEAEERARILGWSPMNGS